jgi:hypothetical protein
MTLKRAVLAALLAGLVAACDEAPEDKPYLEFAGGGFIFNYRIAEAYYGFVARVVRALPEGAILEAELENPSGGAPFILRQVSHKTQFAYSFQSPPLEGVEAERDYRVELRLLDGAEGRVIARYSRTFQSDLGQEALPRQPLAVGPGYHPPAGAADED